MEMCCVNQETLHKHKVLLLPLLLKTENKPLQANCMHFLVIQKGSSQEKRRKNDKTALSPVSGREHNLEKGAAVRFKNPCYLFAVN